MRRGETTEQGRASREGILDAAVVEFTSKGFRGASLKGIADRAGIAKSGLFHHFASKDALLGAVLAERTAAKRHGASEDDFPEGSGVIDQMRQTVERNQFDPTWLRFFTIMIAESFTDEHPALPVIQARYRAVLQDLESRLRAELPGADEQNSGDIAALIVAVMDGLQILRLIDEDFDMRPPFRMLQESLDRLADTPR